MQVAYMSQPGVSNKHSNPFRNFPLPITDRAEEPTEHLDMSSSDKRLEDVGIAK